MSEDEEVGNELLANLGGGGLVESREGEKEGAKTGSVVDGGLLVLSDGLGDRLGLLGLYEPAANAFGHDEVSELGRAGVGDGDDRADGLADLKRGALSSEVEKGVGVGGAVVG